jgi:hypothetical protein
MSAHMGMRVSLRNNVSFLFIPQMLFRCMLVAKNPIECGSGMQQLAKLDLFCGLSISNPSLFSYPPPPQSLPLSLPTPKKCTLWKNYFCSTSLVNKGLLKKD